mmetsp:Transcript_6591/g.10393  ORF Transcript_6591/g.10393 Transcript_6591/m.10393 type:complete len:224 (-) Transcript_6591:216-887(-)
MTRPLILANAPWVATPLAHRLECVPAPIIIIMPLTSLYIMLLIQVLLVRWGRVLTILVIVYRTVPPVLCLHPAVPAVACIILLPLMRSRELLLLLLRSWFKILLTIIIRTLIIPLAAYSRGRRRGGRSSRRFGPTFLLFFALLFHFQQTLFIFCILFSLLCQPIVHLIRRDRLFTSFSSFFCCIICFLLLHFLLCNCFLRMIVQTSICPTMLSKPTWLQRKFI